MESPNGEALTVGPNQAYFQGAIKGCAHPIQKPAGPQSKAGKIGHRARKRQIRGPNRRPHLTIKESPRGQFPPPDFPPESATEERTTGIGKKEKGAKQKGVCGRGGRCLGMW